METRRGAIRDSAEPLGGGPVAWRHLVFWVPGCLLMGAPVAWAAVVAEEKFAPWIIFPLLVGAGLGAMIVWLMRLAQVGNRPTVLLGTVLAVAVAVVGQHCVRYRTERKEVERELEELRRAQLEYPDLPVHFGRGPPAGLVAYLQAEARAGREMNIGGYVARGWMAWLSWALDGLLVLAAALAMVLAAMRLPFCSRCGSWYRVVRSGRVDALTAGRLAQSAGLSPEDHPDSARYRLLCCNGGCGPAALELTWQHSGGAASSARAWLDAEGQERIVRLVDEAKGGTAGSRQ